MSSQRDRLSMGFFFAFAVSCAQAGTNVWEGVVSTNWATGTSWVGGAAPADNTTSDTARFTSASTNDPVLTANRSVNSVVFERGVTVSSDATTRTLTLPASGTIVTVAPSCVVTMKVDVAGNGSAVNLASGARLVFAKNVPTGGSYTLAASAQLSYLGNVSMFNLNPQYWGAGDVLADGSVGSDFKAMLFNQVRYTIGPNASIGTGGSTYMATFGTNTVVVQKTVDFRPGFLNVGVDGMNKNRTASTTLQLGTNTLSVNAVKFCGINGVTGKNPQLFLDGGTLRVGGAANAQLQGLLLTDHGGNLPGTQPATTPDLVVTLGSTVNGGVIRLDSPGTFSQCSSLSSGNCGAMLLVTNTVALINNSAWTNINTATTAAYTGLVVAAGATLGGTGSFYMAANGTTNNAKSVVLSGCVSPGDNGIGTLTMTTGSNVTWNCASTNDAWKFDLGGANGVSDRFVINGNFIKGAGAKFYLSLPGAAAPAGLYTLITWTGSTTFTLADFEITGAVRKGALEVNGNALQFHAYDFLWAGAASQTWADPTAWVGGTAPADNIYQDTATIAGNSTLDPVLNANRSVTSVIFERSAALNSDATVRTLTLTNGGTRLTIAPSCVVTMNVSVASTSGNNSLGSGARLVFKQNAPVGGTYTLADGARLEYLGSMSQFNYGMYCMGTGELLFNGTLASDFRIPLQEAVSMTVGPNAIVTSVGDLSFFATFGTNTIVFQKNFDLRASPQTGSLNVGVDPSLKNRIVKTTLQTGAYTLSVNSVRFCGITGVVGLNPQLIMDGGKLQVGGGGSAAAVKGMLMTLHDGSLNSVNAGLGVQDGVTFTIGSTTNGGLVRVDAPSTFSHVSAVNGNPGAVLQLTNTVTLINNGVWTNINTATTGSYTGLVVEAGATLGGTGTCYMAANGTTNNAKFAVLSGHIKPGDASLGTLKIAGSNITWNCSSAANAAWQFEVGKGNQSDKLEIVGNFKKGTVGADGFCFDFGGSREGGHYELVSWTGASDFQASDFRRSDGVASAIFRIDASGATKKLYMDMPLPGTLIRIF